MTMEIRRMEIRRMKIRRMTAQITIAAIIPVDSWEFSDAGTKTKQ